MVKTSWSLEFYFREVGVAMGVSAPSGTGVPFSKVSKEDIGECEKGAEGVICCVELGF